MSDVQSEESYNNSVVQWFSVAAVIYLIVGALLGEIAAAQLSWPALNMDIP